MTLQEIADTLEGMVRAILHPSCGLGSFESAIFYLRHDKLDSAQYVLRADGDKHWGERWWYVMTWVFQHILNRPEDQRYHDTYRLTMRGREARAPKLPVMSAEQVRLFHDALGDGTDFPKITQDPLVNFYVDRHVAQEEMEYNEDQ